MRSNYFFDLDQLITPAKQRKIMNTASLYLATNNYHDKSCRFDVALVEIENNYPRITYLSDAFSEM
jgi:Holliday junction resolvase-like predicted endonuclease